MNDTKKAPRGNAEQRDGQRHFNPDGAEPSREKGCGISGRQVVTRDKTAEKIGREFGCSGRTILRDAADIRLFEKYPQLELCERIGAGKLTFREARREVHEYLGIPVTRADLEKRVATLRHQLVTTEAKLDALIGGAA